MSLPVTGEARPLRLKEAVRQARIEAAERTGVVVDLRDAELARLELLNEALEPLFADIPPGVDLFDRGVSRGDPPRLWVDMVAHVAMGRDKRVYRFLHDTRYGRRVLAESTDTDELVQAITGYVARRLVERERSLSGGVVAGLAEEHYATAQHRRSRWGAVVLFVVGMLAGAAALIAAAWLLEPTMY